ncbi:hypothetical protein V8C86DRAFT_3084254 [Haematococcus lacustris]
MNRSTSSLSGASGPGGAAKVVVRGEEESDMVEEEVFECERFQPFRVGHWSDRQGRSGGPSSKGFDIIEPQLPPGWLWLEDEWLLDMAGKEDACVDENGWSYALDFIYLTHPPPPNSGKRHMNHFVRRRRYFRTRVREVPGQLTPARQQRASKELGACVASPPAGVTLPPDSLLDEPRLPGGLAAPGRRGANTKPQPAR